VTVSVVSNSGSVEVLVDAPNAKPKPISGRMQQSAVDVWVMPNGLEATFFPDSAGTPAVYFVTRYGIAKRQSP